MRLVPPELRGDKPFKLDEHFRQTRAGVQVPAGWRDAASTSAGIFWLLARSCYTVRVLDLAAVPPPKREAAVRLAIAGWTPYPATTHYVIPHGDSVLLCAWDGSDVAAQISQLGLKAGQVAVVPEAALRKSPDGMREQPYGIEQTLDGVSGVITSGRHRAAEQWWPDAPTLDNWRNFLRGAGIEVSKVDSLPVFEEFAWRSTSVGYPSDAPGSKTSATEQFAVWIAAVILAMPTIWYLNDLRQVETSKRAAGERLAATEKDLDAILSAREVALGLQDRATKLVSLFNPPEPIRLFTIVNDVLGQNKGQATIQLAEWEMRGSSLKFSVLATAGSLPPATTLVKVLEKVEMFRDVEARLDGARMLVTLRIAQPPTAMPSAAAVSTGPIPANTGAKS